MRIPHLHPFVLWLLLRLCVLPSALSQSDSVNGNADLQLCRCQASWEKLYGGQGRATRNRRNRKRRRLSALYPGVNYNNVEKRGRYYVIDNLLVLPNKDPKCSRGSGGGGKKTGNGSLFFRGIRIGHRHLADSSEAGGAPLHEDEQAWDDLRPLSHEATTSRTLQQSERPKVFPCPTNINPAPLPTKKPSTRSPASAPSAVTSEPTANPTAGASSETSEPTTAPTAGESGTTPAPTVTSAPTSSTANPTAGSTTTDVPTIAPTAGTDDAFNVDDLLNVPTSEPTTTFSPTITYAPTPTEGGGGTTDPSLIPSQAGTVTFVPTLSLSPTTATAEPTTTTSAPTTASALQSQALSVRGKTKSASGDAVQYEAEEQEEPQTFLQALGLGNWKTAGDGGGRQRGI